MNRHIGANRRKKHSEKRQRMGNAVGRVLAQGVKGGKLAAIVILVVGGASYGALKLVSWMKHSPLFTVSSITVEGTSRIDKKEIIGLSGIKPGMRMMELRPVASQRAIETEPWVKTARVVRHFPHTVCIRVRERTPIALVSAGNVYYADEDGMLLPLFFGTYSNLPLITGLADVRLDSVKCVAKSGIDRVKRFLDQCASADNAFAKRVSLIDFSASPVIRVSLDDMPVVVEMQEDDIRTSVARLKQLVESMPGEAKGAPKNINLCYENLAYLRW
jgi:POTRA domain, FtsQ-type/Cell division protein FtsQ